MKSTPSATGRTPGPSFAETFRRWNGYIRRAILSIVHDEEVAEDLCQEVWLRFVRYRPHEGRHVNLGGWFATVARRLALNYLASGGVRFRAAITVDQVALSAGEPSPDGLAERAREAERIERVLRALPPRQRTVIRLCDMEGFTYAEAAAHMGISESAVTSLLHRARTAFRRAYLLMCAPAWVRALAEAGPVDAVLEEIDPFRPPVELGDAMERKAHELFGHIAHRWDRIRRAAVPDEVDTALAARAHLSPEDDALDAGTGTGIVALHVAPRVRRVIGIDRSLPMLKVAREQLSRSGSRNVLMEFGDLLQLPIRPESIDVAFCSLVLRLVHRPQEVVRSIARTLRPGGRLVVCDVVRTSDVPTGVPPRQLRTWMESAGLREIALERVGRRRDAECLIAVGHRP